MRRFTKSSATAPPISRHCAKRASSKCHCLHRFRFAADLEIRRVLNGMWQVSGAHGRIDPERAVDAMFGYHDAGFTSWDLADHYGPAEDLIGHFRERFAAQRGS